jgi:hypothetical protein
VGLYAAEDDGRVRWSGGRVSEAIPLKLSAGRVQQFSLADSLNASLLPVFIGDTGSGGSKGCVPAPVSGDSSKFLKGDGTWGVAGGGGGISVGKSLALAKIIG